MFYTYLNIYLFYQFVQSCFSQVQQIRQTVHECTHIYFTTRKPSFCPQHINANVFILLPILTFSHTTSCFFHYQWRLKTDNSIQTQLRISKQATSKHKYTNFSEQQTQLPKLSTLKSHKNVHVILMHSLFGKFQCTYFFLKSKQY